MRIITLEEHFADPAIASASAKTTLELSPGFAAAYAADSGLPYSPSPEILMDIGAARVADMDRAGITMQVLSCLAQFLPADVAEGLTRAANDRAAAAMRNFPGRFSAFAALPTAVPEIAGDELRRCVSELGFVGTMIMGRTDGEFLDQPRFDPILRAASDLGVPIYLHPTPPPRATSAENYDGLALPVTTRLQTAAWGWHQETAVHFLHLAFAGVLDRFPDLQFILGHWGEMIPFYLDRIDEALPQSATGLNRTFRDYFLGNVFITPSGMFSQAQLRYCIDTVGVDRILYAVDYPFIGNEGAVAFLQDAPISDEDKEKIAHRNTERLLGLDCATAS
ncbi:MULTISPECIES: amidohydrolase family protein [unclassified Amycolatopsis]|uniref:amidohydrolase family protein n=1 Tax=unclassified Amycolatopsis TaxID=2618356 RepID=UPI001C69AA9C|nr:amidohydrolase family protein [Amycolatopsis sp. DSM 110486]QYN20223.1 amidohydrolase family protein [Amycolatopsis sp. DSM 110486]